MFLIYMKSDLKIMIDIYTCHTVKLGNALQEWLYRCLWHEGFALESIKLRSEMLSQFIICVSGYSLIRSEYKISIWVNDYKN